MYSHFYFSTYSFACIPIDRFYLSILDSNSNTSQKKIKLLVMKSRVGFKLFPNINKIVPKKIKLLVMYITIHSIPVYISKKKKCIPV